MLRNLLKNAITVSRRCESTVVKPKWDIHVGVLVERLPIITKTLNSMELDVQVRKIEIFPILPHENVNKSQISYFSKPST